MPRRKKKQIQEYYSLKPILEENAHYNIIIGERSNGKTYSVLQKIIEDCYKENVKYLTLEVRVSNVPAIKLYEKYGFKSLGTRKGYYQDNNEDALIMWTENIFYEKYKNIYEKNCAELKNLITAK